LTVAFDAGGRASAERRDAPEQADLSPAVRSELDNALAALEQPRARPQRRRFSNGPRRVPKARGAAFARALSLGIGGHYPTKHLLWSRPSPELMAAVPGDPPRSLLWPVVGGRWGRGFGYTRKVRTELRHNGIDIGAPEGTAVRAAAEGLVIYSDNTLARLGNAVMILHPGGLTTLYGHNLRNTVQPGWYVQRGERVALVGQTGMAWGPHVHFELRDNGRWRDPAPLITGYRDLELTGPLVELEAGALDAREAVTEKAESTPSLEAQIERIEAARVERERVEPENSGGARAEAEAADEASGVAAEVARALPFEIGTLELARQLLSSKPPVLEDPAPLGRKFSNLLWPVKGGQDGRGYDARRHRGVDVAAAAGAPVRAVADGIVVYAGDDLPGYGHTLVLLHREGWVTLYGSLLAEGAADAGTRVLRGEWIGRVGTVAESEPHLHFEWLSEGERRDPSALFVGKDLGQAPLELASQQPAPQGR
jgi:murein DD-endopeptidase MepM/ murein hydrolase activator NlpD